MSESNFNKTLAKAFFNACEKLGLPEPEQAAVLGIDIKTLRQHRADGDIRPDAIQGGAAIMVISIAKNLSSICGDDKDWILHYMNTYNSTTDGVPRSQILTGDGLKRVSVLLNKEVDGTPK